MKLGVLHSSLSWKSALVSVKSPFWILILPNNMVSKRLDSKDERTWWSDHINQWSAVVWCQLFGQITWTLFYGWRWWGMKTSLFLAYPLSHNHYVCLATDEKRVSGWVAKLVWIWLTSSAAWYGQNIIWLIQASLLVEYLTVNLRGSRTLWWN